MRVLLSERLGRTAESTVMRRQKHQRSLIARISRLFFFVVLVTLLATVLIVLPFRWIDPPTTAFMLFDDVAAARTEQRWVAWQHISDSLPHAVLASEDQRFLLHAGIDFASIQKAIEGAQKGARLRGASTITQQVAKNLYLWRGRSFVRKGIEAYLALLIDFTWPKQRILEVYLNIAEFGPGIYGVGAASDIYFGKTARRVTDAEAARLAAVLPNPIRLDAGNPSDYVRERQRWIVGQMQRLRREQVLHAMRGKS